MFRTSVVPGAARRPGWSAVGLLVGLLSAATAHAQTPPTQPPVAQPPVAQPPAQPAQPAQPATPPKNPYIFAGDAAVTLNFIKPDKTEDFEKVIAKLKEALAKSDKPGRKEQAANWKLFKAAEPAGGNILYISIVDPVVKGADYTVSTILAEAFPTEVQALYKTFSDAYASQNILNLTLVAALGK